MANDINNVVIIGNLTADCVSKERGFIYTQGGMCIANFSIANNRNRKNQDGTWGSETSYFDIKLFGKTAENLKPYLTKGQKIAVNGVLKQERWQGKDGTNQSKVVIYANEVELVGGKRDDNSQPQSTYAQQYENQRNPFSQPQQGMAQVQQMAGQPTQSVQPQQMPQQQFFDGQPFDEDIPF